MWLALRELIVHCLYVNWIQQRFDDIYAVLMDVLWRISGVAEQSICYVSACALI